MSTSNGGGKVFGWFANMYVVTPARSRVNRVADVWHPLTRTAVAGLSSWFGIAVTYIRFHRGLKAQGIDRKTLPYRSPLQPFAGWYAAIGCFMVALVSTRLRLLSIPQIITCLLSSSMLHHSSTDGLSF